MSRLHVRQLDERNDDIVIRYVHIHYVYTRIWQALVSSRKIAWHENDAWCKTEFASNMLQNFHVLSGIPPDIMHYVLEDVSEYELYRETRQCGLGAPGLAIPVNAIQDNSHLTAVQRTYNIRHSRIRSLVERPGSWRTVWLVSRRSTNETSRRWWPSSWLDVSSTTCAYSTKTSLSGHSQTKTKTFFSHSQTVSTSIKAHVSGVQKRLDIAHAVCKDKVR